MNMTKPCQAEFTAKDTIIWLIVSMVLLRLLLEAALQPFELLRRKVLGLNEAHDEAFGRPTKHAIYDVFHGRADNLLAADCSAISVSPFFKRAFDAALSVKHIEHRLNGRISQRGFKVQLVLYLLYRSWPDPPQDLH